MRESTYDEKIQAELRQFLWSRFPEQTFEVLKRHIWVTFDRTGGSTRVREWYGDYGEVRFVFRAFCDERGKMVSLRCVGLWQNWLAYENTLERDAEIRSCIPYEEELIDLIKDIK